jgi:hypothetical protein
MADEHAASPSKFEDEQHQMEYFSTLLDQRKRTLEVISRSLPRRVGVLHGQRFPTQAEISASDISDYVRGRVADEVASRLGGAGATPAPCCTGAVWTSQQPESGGATAATVLEIMPTPTQTHSSVFSPSKARPKRPGSAPPGSDGRTAVSASEKALRRVCAARSLAEQWSRLT